MLLTINSIAHANNAPSDDITVTTLSLKYMHIICGSVDGKSIILVRNQEQAAALIASIKAVSAVLDWDLK